MNTQLQNTKMPVEATRTWKISLVSDPSSLLRAGLLGLFMITCAWQSGAQPVPASDPAMKGTTSAIVSPVVIHGMVRYAEDGQPIPGVSIYLKSNTAVGTVSDKDGAFEFPRPVNVGEVILFSAIGLTTFEYEVTAQTAGLLDVKMEWSNILITGEAAMDGVYTEKSSRVQRFWSKVKGLF